MNVNGKLVENLAKILDHRYAFSEYEENGEKLASVLLPLIWKDHKWQLLYIRRADEVMMHKGEVAFPGGGVEETDASFRETALRETREEVGIEERDVQILGSLPAFATISKYCLVPIVGSVTWPIEVKANPSEVTRIFTIPIEWLADAHNWKEEDWVAENGARRRVIHYDLYDGEHLWGITARITLELIKKINKITVE